MSRDIKMFVKPELIVKFQAECLKAGIPTIITCVDRTYKAQYAYFLQGRESLDTVNAARKLAGLDAITEYENKRCITWTMNSEHVINRDDEKLTNDLSRAFDFAVMEPGSRQIEWNVKADVNGNNIADYDECADIAERLGMFSGRRFKNQDYPHVQVTPI